MGTTSLKYNIQNSFNYNNKQNYDTPQKARLWVGEFKKSQLQTKESLY